MSLFHARNRRLDAASLVLLTALVNVSSPGVALASGYSGIRLGAPFLQTMYEPTGLNNAGEMALWGDAINKNIYLYENGTYQQLPTPQSCYAQESFAFGIADVHPLSSYPLMGVQCFAPYNASQLYYWNGTSMQEVLSSNLYGFGPFSTLGIAGVTILTVQEGQLTFGAPAFANPNGSILFPFGPGGPSQDVLGEVTALAQNSSSSYQAIGTVLTAPSIAGCEETETNFFLYSSTGSLTCPTGLNSGFHPEALNASGAIVGYEATKCGSNACYYPAVISNPTKNTKPMRLSTNAVYYQGQETIDSFGRVISTDSGDTVIWRPYLANGSMAYLEGDLSKELSLHNQTLGAAATNDQDQFLPSGGGWGLVSLYLHAVDVSSGSGTISRLQWHKMSLMGPFWDMAVVDTFQGRNENALASSQLANAYSAGLTTAAYVFLNFSDPMHLTGALQMQKAIHALGSFSPTKLAFFAIDVEAQFKGQNTTQSERVKIIEDAISAAPAGIPIIIYSNWGWWNALTGLTSQQNNPFAACGLWDARTDNFGDLVENDINTDRTKPYLFASQKGDYGGWSTRIGKQYEQDLGNGKKGLDVAELEAYSGVQSLDINVFDWNFPALISACSGGQTFH